MFLYQNGTWNQAYVISFTLFPIIVLLNKSKCVGTFYLRYKEDYLASETDRKKNLRQRDQVLIRRRNSNEVASVLCFSMLVTWKALQKPGKMEVARSMALVEVIRKNVILVIKKSELFFLQIL